MGCCVGGVCASITVRPLVLFSASSIVRTWLSPKQYLEIYSTVVYLDMVLVRAAVYSLQRDRQKRLVAFPSPVVQCLLEPVFRLRTRQRQHISCVPTSLNITLIQWIHLWKYANFCLKRNPLESNTNLNAII